MRIRRNSEFANRHYLEELCILNQNPRDILSPWWPKSQSQTDGENDDFCGMASFGKDVKLLLSDMIPTEEGRAKTENELAVYCSFTDARGFKCDVKANAGSQYCEVHVELPKTRRTCSGTRKSSSKKADRPQKRKKDNYLSKSSSKKADRPQKRKKDNYLSKSSSKKADGPQKSKKNNYFSSPGNEMVYYDGFPGLRRKRGRPSNRSTEEAAAVNTVD